MKRALVIACHSVALLGLHPAPAAADATAFVGFSPTVTSRSTTGFAIAVSLVVVGFEFEYAHLNENTAGGAPGVGSGAFNVLLQTPTKTQLYLTAGGGVYHETLALNAHTNVTTNVGGGLKIPIAGPIRIRIDYRVLSLNGSYITKHPQRIYAGINFQF